MSVRVLVVDDSPVMRKMLKRTIEMSKLAASEILEAENGVKALELLEVQWVDLVLTDLHMPQMTGDELLRHMSQHELLKDVPVIVVTSDQADDARSRVGALGCSAFLKKPFRPEQLSELAEKVLGRMPEVHRDAV